MSKVHPSSPIASLTEQNRMFRLSVQDFRNLLKVGDIVFILLSIVLAVYLRTLTSGLDISLLLVGSSVVWFGFFSLLWLFLSSANELNSVKHISTPRGTVRVLVRMFLQIYVVYAIIFFLAPANVLPRLFAIYYAAASTLFVAGWRATTISLISTVHDPHRIILWGRGDTVKAFRDFIKEELPDSYSIVHEVIQADDDSEEFIQSLAHQLEVEDVLQLHNYVSEIVLINSEEERSNNELDALMRAYELGIAIVPMPIFYERVTRRVPVNRMRNDWQSVLPTDSRASLKLYPLAKRVMDIGLALFVGFFLVLLMPLIALAIRLDSKGAIFYSQERMGRNGRNFYIHKFRTMVENAEQLTGPVFAQDRDPRVTRVGRFMRKTRIDELPQVWNVLKGEMSFVGPRPERGYHVDRLAKSIPFYRTRLAARPGLAGWAQVKYGYGADDEDARVKLEYDLYYIRHASLSFDIIILYRTAFKVLAMSGQ